MGRSRAGLAGLKTPRWKARFDLARGLEWASRWDYAARGVVYLGLGAIVLLAAADLTPRARGSS